ncbi:hypothetical protein NZK35_16660 [Stieleria sp. ICT_E10.1]|uniref:hypothetical protein n=1 Tax=Stieleria sedimenti TaxID=2976331 RepID=UPI00217F56B0|nr:hypothetical protein [Stieleria sedimenti]MCS7468285.1 hypothetical protein [Stieleria sedimenti]
MAMTPNEMSAFFAERASKSVSAIDSLKVQNVPLLLDLNFRQAAQNYLMSALVDWRHRLANPRHKLVNAFDACKTAIELLPGLDSPTPLATRFRFYDTVYLATLIDIDPPQSCSRIFQSCRADAGIDLALDYSLAEQLLGTGAILPTIEGRTFSNEQALLRKTFVTYAAILDGNKGKIGTAESNFAERGSDSYYSGGLQIDGGGPDNSSVIDYRLAAILKATGSEMDTIHAMPSTGRTMR